MKRYIVIFSCILLLASAGCRRIISGDSVPVAVTVEFGCETDCLTVSDDTESATFEITANVSWNVRCVEGSDWLSSYSQSGQGNGVITVSFTPNSESVERHAVLQVWAMQDESALLNLYLTQEAYERPVISVDLTFNPSDWSPELTPQQGNLGFTGVYEHKESGYSVEFCCTQNSSANYYAYRGFSIYTISGLASIRFNTNKNIAGWIKLPCPADRVIKSVYIYCPNTSEKKFNIYDSVSEMAVVGSAMAAQATLVNSGFTFGGEGAPWIVKPGLGQTLYLHSAINNAGLSEIIIEFE